MNLGEDMIKANNYRIQFKKFSELSQEEKMIIYNSWSNPINARYNSMKDPMGSIEELYTLTEPTFKNLNDYYDCMYFRVVIDQKTNDIVGTCRYGKYYKTDEDCVWDFGFNVVLKFWYEGYGTEILSKIIDIARASNIKSIVGSADKENFGSYKAMIKNGFEYIGIDDDGDYEYSIDLSKDSPSQVVINHNWNDYIDKLNMDLGKEYIEILEQQNLNIRQLVERLKNEECENILISEFNENITK
jgi:RimJ/RimL family protein N-acetyltransferase